MASGQVKISNYENYSSENYGSSRVVHIGSLSLYFSYETVIAFSDAGEQKTSINVWGSTTGKHLNWICPNKKERLPRNIFEKELAKVLKKHKLSV